MRPPRDPYLRKGRPEINPDAPKETDIADVLNRGEQILLELDRQHQRLHDAAKAALKPDPRAWKGAKAAKADYDQAYSELVGLSKRLNVILQNENPEMLNPPPALAGTFGHIHSENRGRRKR